MVKKVRLILTRFWLKTQHLRYLQVARVELPENQSAEVVVFSNRKPCIAGVFLPWGTILIHKKVFGNRNLLEYVSVHEFAHKRRAYGILFSIIGWLAYVLVLFLLLGILLSLTSIFNRPWSLTVTILIVDLLEVAICFFIGLIFCWFPEYQADYEALHKLGVAEVLRGRFYWQKIRQCTKSEKVYAFLTHPPISLTTWFFRRFHRD
jgi:hypothetical protein